MDSDFIVKAVRRSNRNQLILWGIGLTLVLVSIALSMNQFYNLLAGPFPADEAYIEGIQDVTNLSKFHVSIKGQQTIDTGISEVRYTYFIQTGKSYYKALVLGDHLFLVRSGSPDNFVNYSGALKPISSIEQQKVVDAIARKAPNTKDAFLPIMMDADGFLLTSYIGLAAAVIGLLVCLWGFLRTIARVINYERHPIWRGLKRFGEPSSVAEQIGREVGRAETIGAAQMTRNWLIVAHPAIFDVTRLKDIVWIFKKIENGRYGQYISANIYDRHGKLISVVGKNVEVEETLNGIATRLPWVIIGYSDKKQGTWKKDRAKFIEAVDQRREQVTNQ